MQKNKREQGITLIALIITIIVLLILAVVAIGAVQNDGIINYAKNARYEYGKAQTNENATLGVYLKEIEENLPGNNGGITYAKATVGTVVTENGTINGKEPSATNPVIPKGFKAINTDTSSWDAESGPEVTKGLVISDGTSEFVFIPVANIDEFARVTSGKDANDRTNYQGVLYDFSGTTATEKTNYGQGTTSHREPANLETSYDNTTNLSIWTENLYQESFNKMVESVIKYKGFYVGRYETSLNGTVAQSISGVTPLNTINWFRMYESSLTYSSSNTSLGVQSEMIWGCQWDAMLKFILTGTEADHVTSTLNAPHDYEYYDEEEDEFYTTDYFVEAPYRTGGTNYLEDYTGNVEYNDKASNIYDIEGNVYEWTQEAQRTKDRVARGGSYTFDKSPGRRFNDVLSGAPISVGSRLTLYIR